MEPATDIVAPAIDTVAPATDPMTSSPRTDRSRPPWAAVLFERRRRLLLVILLVATLAVGSGLLAGQGGDFEFASFGVDSGEHQADTSTTERFDRDTRPVTQVVIRSESTSVVSRPVLLETLRLQQQLRADPDVRETLTDDQPTVGVANAVALATDPRLAFGSDTDLDSKYRTLEDRTDEQIAASLGVALRSDDLSPPGQPPVSSLLPRGYEAGEPAEAQLIVVVHDESATDDELLAAQKAIESTTETRVADHEVDSFVIGQQLAVERSSQATAESFILVGPLIILVVVGLLALSYRDPLDVALACLGIALTFVWLGGAMGWLGRSFNQLLIAVPCLLVGLGVDYSLHVVMRQRENRMRYPSLPPERAMTLGIAGVLVAIGVTTLTTATGFLAGIASPIGILREFGLVAAIGIASAFVVFGLLIPALRIELDGLRTRGGRPPATPATVGSLAPVRRLLDRAGSVGIRRPLAIVALAVLLAAGGAMGATAVETTTDRTEFLPADRAAWMEPLPEAIRPSATGLRENAQYTTATFETPSDRTVEILIEGNVTDDSVGSTLDAARSHAVDQPTTQSTAGEPRVSGPLETIEQVAVDNETVATLLDESDTTGDGVPDRNLTALFDAVYAADPSAASETIHRTPDGEYDALRVTIVVDDTADSSAIRADADSTAAIINQNPNLRATPTGEPVLEAVEQGAILETILATFLLALVVISVLLVGLFRRRHGSWSLGAVTILPVLMAIAWLIGTLWVFSVPFTAEIALIVAIAIGLGTDYTVHLTERFATERRHHGRETALRVSLTETGGAVLASGLTTVAAFGLLLLTVVPSLQRFGFVTALVVAYSVLATVVVLPALLVLWDRRRPKLDETRAN